MREMKESGIEWIGKIPNDWYAVRIKYLSKRIIVGLAMPVTQYYVVDGVPIFRNTNIEEDYLDDKDLLYLEPRFAYSQRSKRIKTNDILTIHTGYVGKSCLVPKEYNGALTFTTLITTADKSMILPRFLMYTINASREKSSIYIVDSSAQNNLNTAVFINLPLPLPSIDEQKALLVFLDSKCEEINALSADIKSEIETLEAYKRSVITEAVTKGLNPHVEMKDSGIEWIGEVPAHWMMLRGKYVFEQKSDRGNTKSLVLLSPTQNYGVIPQDMYEKLSGFSAVKLNEKTDLSQLKTVHRGAFVISLRSFQGGFEYSNFEGVVSPAYQVFYPTFPVHDGYYKYLFKTQIFIDKMNSYTMSLRDGKNIAFTDFGRTYIPVPPIEEQKKIVDCLNQKCSEIDTIIHQKKEQLEILDEYKKSLIYEYVTGKKEVPAT